MMKSLFWLILPAVAFPCGFLLGSRSAPVTAPPGGVPAAAGRTVQAGETAALPGVARVATRLAASAAGGSKGLAESLRAARADPALFGCLLDTWRMRDPERLLPALATLAEDPLGIEMVMARTLALDMADADPERPLCMARGMPDSPLRDHLVSSAILALFGTDPAKALETAAAWPGVPLQGGLPAGFQSTKLTAEQIPAILALPDGESREYLLAKALGDNFPPARALEEVERMPGAERWRVTGELARRFAEEDPAGAMAAAEASESFATRTALREAVGLRLAETDPAAAARWAEERLSTGQKLLVMKKAAEKLLETNQEAAAKEILDRLSGE